MLHKGTWKSSSKTAKMLCGHLSVEEDWGFVNYNNTYATKSLVGQCRKFIVYLVPNWAPESVDLLFLKNNGCEL